MSTRFLTVLLVFAFLGGWAGPVVSKTLKVPEDYASINDAMRDSRHGDIVLVGPGIYEGPVDVKNGVILKSADGPEVTTIKGYRWWVVRLADADTLTALIGFTVDGSRAADRVVYCSGGGSPRVLDNVVKKGWFGISCEESSAIIRNNRVQESRQGIACDRSSPMIIGNRITDNGKGIALKDANPRIENNVIDLNQMGILIEDYAVPVIGGSFETANDIFDNFAYDIQNLSLVKSEGIRTLMPALVTAEYNYWGSDCPLERKFAGAVDYKPWVDKEHKKTLRSCPGR